MINKILIILNTLGLLLFAATFLIQRRYIFGCFMLFLSFCSFWYGKNIVFYLSGLGTDSLLEIKSFDLIEALGFLKTLKVALLANHFPFTYKGYLLLFILFTSAMLIFKFFSISNKRRIFLSLILVSFSIAVLGVETASMMTGNTKSRAGLAENFVFDGSTSILRKERGLKLVVFIGESTSIMNLGIYGYFRDTTPNLLEILEKDSGLLKFDNVFSTHVHTVPSLLEALSIKSAGHDEEVHPIHERQRTLLVDILNNAGLETHLVSNQARSGSWNIAGPILFKRATTAAYNLDERYSGNMDWAFPRQEESLFFKEHLEALLQSDRDSVVFLHSYIGHYFYKSHLPDEFDKPVDNRYLDKDLGNIFGDSLAYQSVREDVEKSDSSYKYLDHVLTEVIKKTQEKQEPVVLIYFSDHGDAVYAGLGHDSARFQHEMARVPFIIYFNERARTQYSDIYQKYLALSRAGRTSTLNQLSSTILDIAGVTAPAEYVENVIGADVAPSPILVRETSKGITYVNPFYSRVKNAGPKQFDVTDEATQIYQIASNPDYAGNIICYHRSNSIAKAIRGLLVTDCLELDIVVSSNGEIYVDHDLPRGPKLEDILNVLNQRDINLWLDGKNIDKPENCLKLAGLLNKHKNYAGRTLVEFPSNTDFDLEALRACIIKLENTGIAVSFYLPTLLGMKCMKSRSDPNESTSSDSTKCREFKIIVSKAIETGLIGEISFDVRLLDLVNGLENDADLAWNTRGISAKDISAYDQRKFRRIILNANADPNAR